MLAIDCVQSSKSRNRVYVRSQGTSFDNIVDDLTLGGVLRTRKVESALPSLQKLWWVVLALDTSVPSSPPTPPKKHRTAGMSYYYEFKSGSSTVKVKLYFPVGQYGINDREIAMGVASFLKSQDMHLQGAGYANAVEQLW